MKTSRNTASIDDRTSVGAARRLPAGVALAILGLALVTPNLTYADTDTSPSAPVDQCERFGCTG